MFLVAVERTSLKKAHPICILGLAAVEAGDSFFALAAALAGAADPATDGAVWQAWYGAKVAVAADISKSVYGHLPPLLAAINPLAAPPAVASGYLKHSQLLQAKSPCSQRAAWVDLK